MTITYLKTAVPAAPSRNADIRDVVSIMLANIRRDGEAAVRDYADRLDGWQGEIVLGDAERVRAHALVPDAVKDDIRFAYDNIRRFAEAQKATMAECEVELIPGHWAGQKQIPVSSAGCYVPGGRYSHIASALMTVTTARVAGVPHVTAASPPRPDTGIPAAIIYAMDLAGADLILNLGGVQAVTAMAEGFFGAPPADILVGPGNAYVAEAKRALFGKVGIDMFAGPTDSLIIADDSADAETLALDLVGQAEHGADSPVWLVTTCDALARAVMDRVPAVISALPEPNRSAARAAWRDHAEVILCTSREDAAQTADRYAPEHLQVLARDLDWWLERLSVYGSLFLGRETTVPFGDKVAGPNHVLPTSGAARYTGGLSVHKFTKTVTWQRCDEAASQELAVRTARISRIEGMEGHARSAEARLRSGREPNQPPNGASDPAVARAARTGPFECAEDPEDGRA